MESRSMAEQTGEIVFRVDGSDNDSDLWDDSALIKAYDKAISSVKGMTKDEGEEKKDKNRQKRKRGGKKKNKKNSPLQTKWKVGDHCKSVFTEDDQVYSAVIKTVNARKRSCIVQYVGYGNEEEKRLSDLFTESEADVPNVSNWGLENGYDSMEWTDHSQSPMHPTNSNSKGAKKRPHYPPPPSSSHPPYPPRMLHHLPGYPNPYGGSWYPPPPPVPPPVPPPPLPTMSPLPFAPWGSPAPQIYPGWTGASPHSGNASSEAAPSSIPPGAPPPHPPLPENVDDMDKEALHSMLMSWYMSGYHTGYYQGLKRSKVSRSAASKPEETEGTSKNTQSRQTEDKTNVNKEEEQSQPPLKTGT